MALNIINDGAKLVASHKFSDGSMVSLVEYRLDSVGANIMNRADGSLERVLTIENLVTSVSTNPSVSKYFNGFDYLLLFNMLKKGIVCFEKIDEEFNQVNSLSDAVNFRSSNRWYF